MTIKTRTTLVKLLAQNGIVPVEISGRGQSLSVTLQNEKDMRKFCKKIAPWGGFATGWNGWILRQNYQAPVGSSDFNDVSSYHHY